MKELFEDRYSNLYVTGMADYVQFSYEELWERAHTIAVITPLDELSVENSYGISDSGDCFYNAHSIRAVQALTFYKNSKGYSENFEVVEVCAMLDDGSVVGMENCYPMYKGETYLVFLGDSGWGYPIVLSADNGKFDLTNLRLNLSSRQPLLAKAMMDMELLSMARSADEALSYFGEAVYLTDNRSNDYEFLSAAYEWETMLLSSSYTAENMELSIEYAKTDTGYLYRIGEFIFEVRIG